MRPASQAARFTPRGVADTLSAADSQAGACRSLANLIFDPATPNTFQCRPAVTELSNFPGFNTPGAVSVAKQYGTRIYGLVASQRFPGKDEPFIYDVASNSFVTLTGVTSGSCPATQSSSGEWTPPTIDMMGVYVIITHPGFPGGVGNYFGWFDVTNVNTPSWNAGNTGTNSLTTVPTSVVQFNNRAYFSLKNMYVGTDALTLTITNASQFLTISGNDPITAAIGIPISTTDRGILQGIQIFKESEIHQLTGDYTSTTTPLVINQVSDYSGTKAPRSVAITPKGIKYVDVDGLRTIANGIVSDPDPDVRVPFISALTQTRISAAYNSGIYRVCVQNGAAVGSPYEEYWNDLTRNAWTGPHPWRQDLVIPYNKTFICFRSDAYAGRIYQSDPVQTVFSTFTELGVAMQWTYATSPIGETASIFANSVLQSTLMFAYNAAGQTYQLSAQDVNGGVLATAVLTSPSVGSIWNAFLWGTGLWGAARYGLAPVNIPWTKPLVFTTLVIQASGPSSRDLKVGAFKMQYKVLNYIP